MKKNQFPEGAFIVFACSRFPGKFCIGVVTIPPKMREKYVTIAQGVLVPLSAVIVHDDATDLLKADKKADAIELLQNEDHAVITGLSKFKEFGATDPTKPMELRVLQTVAA